MMMKIKCCNGTCFYIISFRLVLDRKDFEQANTDGHKKQCYNRPVLPSSTKILLRVKVFGNIVIFFTLKHLMTTTKRRAYIDV